TNVSSPTISNNTITANSASNGAGISCVESSAPTISNNTIAKNSALQYGGGIYCSSSSPTISNNTITENGAIRYGGGIYCSSSSSPTISNNTITANSATNGGGICSFRSSSPAISNNTIAANSVSRYGGGIYCYYYSSPAISNNTITANSASSNGGGIYCEYESSPSISNNIIAFNSSGIYRYGGSPALRNNCVYNPDGYDYSGISPGTGDIQVDPLFVDCPGGNYHLRYGSPCRNVGWDDVVQPGWLDIDGQPRRNGVVDIGSDEYYPSTVSEARSLPDECPVETFSAVVTGVFDGFFYVESENRVVGIQVRKADHGLAVGTKVSIIGILRTDDSSGERYISASSVQQVGTGSVNPFGMTNLALGGADWRWNPSNGAGQRGVTGGIGLNNIGLLVRTTGRVIDAGSGWFVIDDGSAVNVKCVVQSGVSVPGVGSYAVVTGISSCERVGDEIRRLLRVRSGDDIVTY
ncbi:MAG: right-handed parallel beta-helix repeat-containing protein, partial [Armatimonadetes bacterium]|nr:right-handed parallel beta-helix repeat-containing protein [Armatimonadota bacterium]